MGKTPLQKEIAKKIVKEGRPQPIPPSTTSTKKELRDSLKTICTTSHLMRDTKASLE